MTATHVGCFRWYGKCKHMNRIWVTIERTCKRTAKKIGYKQQIGLEHQDLQCKRSLSYRLIALILSKTHKVYI